MMHRSKVQQNLAMDPFDHPQPAATPSPDARVRPPDRLTQKGGALPWVPIRQLQERHRPLIVDHLLQLDEHDRYLRFGFAAQDGHIQRYVAQLDFDRDELFGIFNRRLALIGQAHLAYPVETSDEGRVELRHRAAVEFGGSVVPAARGFGHGKRLFEHAMLRARNRGYDTLFIHALTENTQMLRIARWAGGIVHSHGSETDAHVLLPPTTVASRLEQWVSERIAQIDYRMKRRAHQPDATTATSTAD